MGNGTTHWGAGDAQPLFAAQDRHGILQGRGFVPSSMVGGLWMMMGTWEEWAGGRYVNHVEALGAPLSPLLPGQFVWMADWLTTD